MRKVIVNSTPLIGLFKIGRLDILKKCMEISPCLKRYLMKLLKRMIPPRSKSLMPHGYMLKLFMKKRVNRCIRPNFMMVKLRSLDRGFSYYYRDTANLIELQNYERLRDLIEFAKVPENGISSSGYVVASLEAAIWSLITTNSFKDCLLNAVNLGHDSDTIGAIAGGLAGLYYDYERMPEDWLFKIQKRKWIEEMCAMKRN